jgi:hypothetical protein
LSWRLRCLTTPWGALRHGRSALDDTPRLWLHKELVSSSVDHNLLLLTLERFEHDRWLLRSELSTLAWLCSQPPLAGRPRAGGERRQGDVGQLSVWQPHDLS